MAVARVAVTVEAKINLNRLNVVSNMRFFEIPKPGAKILL